MTQDTDIQIDPATGLPLLSKNYIFAVEKFNPNFFLYNPSSSDVTVHKFYITSDVNGSEYYSVSIYQVRAVKRPAGKTFVPVKNKFLAYLGATEAVTQYRTEILREKCISRSDIVKEIYSPLSAVEVPDYIKDRVLESSARKKVVLDAREFSKELVFKHACIAYKKWEEYTQEETRIKNLEESLLGEYPPKELK